MNQPDFSRRSSLVDGNSPQLSVFTTDVAGNILSWNDVVEQLFGYSAVESIGQSAETLLPCGDRRAGALQEQIGIARREGSYSGTARLVRKTGDVILADIVITRLDTGPESPPTFAYLIRKCDLPAGLPDSIARTALHLTHAFVRSLDGTILLWTRGAQRLYGWTPEEAQGRPAAELLGTTSALPLDQIVSIVRTHGDWQGELAHRCRDGSTVFLASHWTLFRDAAGNPAAIVEVNNDITSLIASQRERQSLLHELTEIRARLEAVVQQMPLGVLIVQSPSGELLMQNGEAARLLRHPINGETPVAGQTSSRCFRPDGTACEIAEFPLSLALEGHFVKDQELRYRRGDETLTHLMVSAAPVRDSAGNVVAAVMIFSDVSERKQAEIDRDRLLHELRRSNDDLSQFAHTVSHDLQEPLRTMRSYSDLLLRRYSASLDANGVEFVRYIAAGAERMDELVQALLLYARAGGPQLTLEEIPVVDIVTRAIINLQPVIETTGGFVEHGPLPALPVDALQMTQVFQNLIGNAFKYRARDVTPRVSISAEPRGAEWVFTVEDNGVGIPPKQHDRIFAPLKRLHGATVPGSGMGLAICRKIIQRHGGDIWVESDSGKGAAFRFTLPK